jgi:glycosyltransferase involved in cell wall biosynthesis
MANGLNVHMYPSPFTHETRILRVTNTLIADRIFDDVLVVAALRKAGTAEHEAIDAQRRVWRIPVRTIRGSLISKMINSLEWNWRAFRRLRRERIACLNAHALSVLPLGVLLRRLKRCKLVYDAHEIETETTETRGARQRLSKWLERWLVRHVDVLVFTSHGHADWYRRHYGLTNIRVIRNHPYRRATPFPERSIFREKFGIGNDELLFLYQGAIARPRGTSLLMDVFSRLPKHLHIVFMGFGEDLDRLRALEKTHSNVHYHPAVAPGEVANYTSGADVGIHMMDDSCVNHLYALPNKPLEYMNAGIPAIVSDLPEMGRLIRESGGGWVVAVNDDAALERLIVGLTREEIVAKAARAREWAEVNTWENEEIVLREMYAALGFTGARGS